MKKRIDDDHKVLLLEDGEAKLSSSAIGFTQWPHVFNLCNCIVGVSLLAIPYCFQQCGILLGTILIGFCSLLTKITCHLLYQAAIFSRRKSYEGIAFYAFGNKGRRVVELSMVLFLMSSMVSFMVVIGDIGPHVLADYLELQAPTQRLRVLVMVFVFLSVILPLSLLHNINSFSGISSVIVFFYFIFVLRIMVECIPRIFDGQWSSNVYWWRQDGLLTSLPIISMALACQTQLFCVADCIKHATAAKVDTVVSDAINICSSMYAAVGAFGYVAFHDTELHGDILLYLHTSFLTQLLKLAFMLSVAVSIPLMLFPTRAAFYNLFFKSDASEYALMRMSPMSFLLITFSLLVTCLLTAITAPNVEFILGITGALIGSLVTIFIPSLLFIAICHSAEEHKILLIYAKICVVVGLLILILSTWAVLHTKHKPNVIDVILPKEIAKKSDTSNEKSKEMLLMGNYSTSSVKNIVQLSGITQRSNKGVQEIDEAKQILHEMKEQRKVQDKILKEQKAIVDELQKHHELHLNEKLVINNTNVNEI